MNLVLFLTLCLVCVVSGSRSNLTVEWEQWLNQYGYHDNEDRFDVWADNWEYIQSHNSNPHTTYTLAMNHFGTLSREEFVSGYQCVGDVEPVTASQLNSLHNTTVFRDYSSSEVRGNFPSSMDWRTSGAVAKVKDQLRCGSSYAFSAMGSLEGLTALAYRHLVKLSEQNIVDCSGPYGNYGCACGEVNKALLYVIDNGGVDTWDGYPSGGHPYRSKQYACAYDPAYKGASATGIVVLASGDEESLLSAVATMGPVSVYVDGTSTMFQFYSDGVLDIPYCSTTRLSHALVIIGYGTSSSGGDYWLVKNSWGPNWGVWGFGMLARNKNNHCGIATSPSLPTL